MPPAQTVVHLVPHTHWDREWYLPFQSFRLRLVDLIDRVLDLLEAEPRFVFTLDGQLATVDDYLEIRPEAEPRIRALVEEGRLAVGPWQILVDEFLVSGETIVRNLECGLRRGEELGGAMPVGYLPDMFGHVAQMPQILRRAGISDAVVWRGVPAAIDRHAFQWEAPDGSSVRAEYLPGGYGNAAYLFAVPARLAAKVELFHEAMRPFFDGDAVLAMYGTDHAEPLPDLVDLVEQANRESHRFRIELQTLDKALTGSDPGADPVLTGELRSGARANLLMGVSSARIDLKAACARAERLLERYAEPLLALHGEDWPESLLRLAWRRVIENSAHDSICGCSVDAVSEQVLVRYAEAEQIASGLARRAAEAVAQLVPVGAAAVLNPSPHARNGLVELDLAIPEEWREVALELPDGSLVSTQEAGRSAPLLYAGRIPGAEIPQRMFRRLHGRELYGRRLNGYRIDQADGVRRLTFEVDEVEDPPWLDTDELELEIEIAVQAAPDEPWEVRILARPRRTLLASVPAPALGWTAVRPARGLGLSEGAVLATPEGLSNGLLDVQVAPDGTLRGGELAGVGRLVDGGDGGDSYNYAPPATDTLVEEPESVAVEVLAAGPVRGELAVVRTYRWPLGLLADGSARTAETALVPVTTAVELRAGEPFLRLRVSFENPCSDHRLRLHVPLAAAARGSAAEGQFAVVERGLEAEGGYGEVPLPTFPARGFADAGGVALLLDHVMEYEVVDGRELALTVLRSVGLISRNTHPYREDPAGPELPIPGAQCKGPRSVGLAVYPHAGSWSEAAVLAQMERYRHPFLVAPGSSTGELREAAGLEVSGDGVLLSSLRRRGDWLELRLVCEQPEARTALVAGGFREAREADLLGRPGDPLELTGGELRLELAAWEIRTVQLKR